MARKKRRRGFGQGTIRKRGLSWSIAWRENGHTKVSDDQLNQALEAANSSDKKLVGALMAAVTTALEMGKRLTQVAVNYSPEGDRVVDFNIIHVGEERLRP